MNEMIDTNGHNAQGEKPKRAAIDRLRLRNFKGIDHFDLIADGHDVTIRGDNATGKTTIADAVSWLLFGKDSSGRADFEIKTLDASGEAIHNLEHEVEAELTVGSTSMTLRKVYAEKWTRKRGEAAPTFTGHETTCYVNEVPVKVSDYEAQVAEIAPEELTRMLSDVFYVIERMHWEERRGVLLEVCGDVTDEDVIASDPALKDLPEILNGRTMDDARQIIHAKRKKINQELKSIPVRIDEAKRSIRKDRVGDPDEATAAKDLETLRAMRKEAEAERSRIEGGGEVAEKRKELSEIETKISDLKRAAREEAFAGREKLLDKRSDINSSLSSSKRELARYEPEIARILNRVTEIKSRMDEARERWKAVDSEQFEHNLPDTCAACGQKLPVEKVEDARDKALKEFNASKVRRLNRINEEGESLKAEKVRLEEDAAALEEKVEILKAQIAEHEEALEKIEQQIDEYADRDLPIPAEVGEATEAAAELKRQIATLQEDTTEALEVATAKVASLDDDIETQEAVLAEIRASSRAEERIAELERDERRLASDFEEMERCLYLLDQFLRAKVELLTERINSRFDTVRWKLFEVQINGGLKEACEPMVAGVPIRDVNNAARINAGLEVLDVLGDHYGVILPVFVDQAESVTQIRPTEAQQIVLAVDARYDQLHVETSGHAKEVAA